MLALREEAQMPRIARDEIDLSLLEWVSSADKALRAIHALADKSPCSCEGCECDLGFVVENAAAALLPLRLMEAPK